MCGPGKLLKERTKGYPYDKRESLKTESSNKSLLKLPEEPKPVKTSPTKTFQLTFENKHLSAMNVTPKAKVSVIRLKKTLSSYWYRYLTNNHIDLFDILNIKHPSSY